MKIEQLTLSTPELSADQWAVLTTLSPQLVLVFASISHFEDCFFPDKWLAHLPKAQWVGCSTAGEISSAGLNDNHIVLTAIRFDHPDFQVARAAMVEDAAETGKSLASQLDAPDLNHVLVFGQGVGINGSTLIEGLKHILDSSVVISGGLAGDAGQFRQSYVMSNHGVSSTDIVAIGFYGDYLRLTAGSFGGWRTFGTARLVSRVQGNILYELDGKPALELYKTYLGDYAQDLPASALLFPLAIINQNHLETGIIRTILGINEEDGSLILAGDLVEGGYVRLMHASTDALVNGAQTAAETVATLHEDKEGLALLVSCVGRKLLMGGRTEEEVEAVGSVLGKNMTLAGFYSNGEISPLPRSAESRLHNQTMTITCLSER